MTSSTCYRKTRRLHRPPPGGSGELCRSLTGPFQVGREGQSQLLPHAYNTGVGLWKALHVRLLGARTSAPRGVGYRKATPRHGGSTPHQAWGSHLSRGAESQGLRCDRHGKIGPASASSGLGRGASRPPVPLAHGHPHGGREGAAFSLGMGGSSRSQLEFASCRAARRRLRPEAFRPSGWRCSRPWRRPCGPDLGGGGVGSSSKAVVQP